ncbi:MAG TPA: GatB/YqeY domain-containing protein [Longimicrobiales bacterium]
MALKDTIRDELNSARKQRDKLRTVLFTSTLSEIKYKEVELGREATDADVLDVINKAIKRRREASEQMRAGNRLDLAEKEDQEAALLTKYLPAQLSESEVRGLVRDAIAGGANNMGAVMGKIMPKLKGAFDGREANRIVKEELENAHA